MSNDLRSKVIRLAHQQPELRPHLLPLLKTAATPTTMAKAVKKLIEDAKKELEAFKLAKIPADVRGQYDPPISVHFESRPLKGGYGPYEIGELNVSGLTLKLVGELNGNVQIGMSSGPHYLSSVSSRGTAKDAPKRLQKPLDVIQSSISRDIPASAPSSASAFSFDDITRQLRGIQLGPAGRVRSVDPYPSEGSWSIEPANRMRLDHYVGAGYEPGEDDDPEGWDEEGWGDEYAGPTRSAAIKWLNSTFGSGLFGVDVGEKGHVEVYLTPAGRKQYGVL